MVQYGLGSHESLRIFEQSFASISYFDLLSSIYFYTFIFSTIQIEVDFFQRNYFDKKKKHF